ncbi:ammonium transporter [Caulobacter sp. 17J65-9]|uniref:ammonium transporter n=1 Tax=Caulobacter sp. 17J65-9 TaxID=2709382 RepID=UPI001969E26B|nr:ammonium transporter [Caulobacter sp. 17J65-9]
MKKDLTGAFAWGGGILVVALVASYARHHGYVDSDTVTRLVVGLNGLMIAWFGNRIPKTVVPSACARQAQRVAGWSMVLSGLAYAGLWAFAPMQVAITAGCGAVIAGIAVTIGYCLWLRSRAKAA